MFPNGEKNQMTGNVFSPDERKAAWKILLPWNSHIGFHKGADNWIDRSMLRSYEEIQTSSTENDSISYKKTKKNHYSVFWGNKEEKVLREEFFFSVPQCEKPKLYISLRDSFVFREGIRFHVPGSCLGKIYLQYLKYLSFIAFPLLQKHANITIRSNHLFWNGIYENIKKVCPEIPSIRGINIYSGSQSVSNKITCQIICEDKSEFVAKIADTEQGKKVIMNETRILDFLQTTELYDNIPHVLGKMENEYYIQLQTCYKLQAKHEQKELHPITVHFLSKMADLNQGVRSGKDVVSSLNLSHMLPNNVEKIKEHCIQIEQLYTSLCHGDFAPWNIFLRGNSIFVYDWEDATFSSMPSGIDLFHFMFRSRTLLHQWRGWNEFSSAMMYYCRVIGYKNHWKDLCRVGILREYSLSGENSVLNECMKELL